LCNICVLFSHALSDDKGDVSIDNFYAEFYYVFDHFPKYHIKIMLGDHNAKLEREDIFKPTFGNESVYQDSNDNDVRITNFATAKNIVIKSTMFPHRNIHEHTWNSYDGLTNSHILIDKRRPSSVFDMPFFRGADCDTDHRLVVAKVRKKFAVIKQKHRILMWRDLTSVGGAGI